MLRIFLLFLQSLICRALYPRVLRALFARVDTFGHYSVCFEDHEDGQHCIGRTWEKNVLLEVCVSVEPLVQVIPAAEFAAISRVVSCLPSSQMLVAILPISQSIRRVMSDNREDGRRFVFCREFTSDFFIRCFQQAQQEIFGMLEVTAMVDFLMLRLKGALYEHWMEDVPQLRPCVIAGRVLFGELRGVVKELIVVWNSVREFMRFTGHRHIKSESDRVSLSFPFVFFLFCFFWITIGSRQSSDRRWF